MTVTLPRLPLSDAEADLHIDAYLISSPDIEDSRSRLRLMIRHVAQNAHAEGLKAGWAQAMEAASRATEREAQYPPITETL